MAKILLPGYQTAVDNRVYFRNGLLSTRLGCALDSVVILERYKTCTREDVMDYITKAVANKLESFSQGPPAHGHRIHRGVRETDVDQLYGLIGSLPTDVFFAILAKDPSIMQYIDESIPEGVPKDKDNVHNRVHVEYGLIPSRSIEAEVCRTRAQEADPEWYEEQFESPELKNHDLGYAWDLELRLAENFALPDIAAVRRSLNDEVRGSNIMSVNRDPYKDPETLRNVVEALYEGLPGSSARRLTNTSNTYINYLAKIAILVLPEALENTEARIPEGKIQHLFDWKSAARSLRIDFKEDEKK